MRKWAKLGLAAAGLTIGSAALAQAFTQRAGEITLYSEIGFRGQTYTITGERENIRLTWRPRSVMVRRGETWELCNQSRYRGCQRITESVANVSLTIGSARPIRTGTPAPAPAPGGGQSLRGGTAEFFVTPSDTRGRIESCRQGTAACAAESADRFCRNRGWTASSYEKQQSVSGRNYLSDVLCTRTR